MTLLVQPMQSAAPLDPRGRPADNTPVSRFFGCDSTRNRPRDQLGPPRGDPDRPNEPIRKDAYREIRNVTIHEHDRVSADRDGTGPHSTHALVDRLTAGEPYAVAFGGQGSAWLETLEELVSSAGIESDLATLVGEVELLLEPVAKELVVVRPIGFEPLQWVRALAAEDPVPSDKHLTSAAVSIPGVLLTQIAAGRALARQGMDLGRHAAGGRRRALARCARRRGVQVRGRARCRAAGLGPADRCGRDAGGPPARHLGARRPPADGVGDQRRPRAHPPAARRVRAGSPHRAAPGAVHPQRPAFGRHHRHARAVVAFRAVLPADLREGRGRPQEQDPRRRRLRPGLRSGAGGGRLPHAAAGRRYRHRRRLGGEGGPRRRVGPPADRGHPGGRRRLGGGDHPGARGRCTLDP